MRVLFYIERRLHDAPHAHAARVIIIELMGLASAGATAVTMTG